MWQELQIRFGYTPKFSTFKKHYRYLFGNIADAREIYARKVKNLLREKGVSTAELNELFPWMKEFDYDLFYDLTRKGYSKKYIAEQLGYSKEQVNHYVTLIIAAHFPELPMYKESSWKKQNPSFEDLQYRLMAEDLFAYMYESPRIQKSQLADKFPGVSSEEVIDNIIKRVLWLGDEGEYGFKDFRDELIETIIIVSIFRENVEALKPFAEQLNIPYRTFLVKTEQFIGKNKYVEMTLRLGFPHTRIELVKVAILGPYLENSLRAGLDNDEILRNISPSYSVDDLDRIAELIWGVDLDGVRLLLNSRRL